MEYIENIFSIIVTFIFNLLAANNVDTSNAPEWLKEYVKTDAE